MKRYFRLYLYFLRFSFSKALQFRLDFFFRIIMDIIYYVVNISLFKVLYHHTNLIGGWNEGEMMLFIGSYLVVDAIGMTVFANNMWWLPYYINKGELDYYLTRPISPLFFLSLREFASNSFINLLIAVSFFIYSVFNFPGKMDIFSFLIFLGFLINGVLIHYVLQMLMVIPVFWTQGPRGFTDLFYTLGVAMERPHTIFKGWLRTIFTIILPFGIIASMPAQILIEGLSTKNAVHMTFVTIGMWMLMLISWKKGLANYSSASS
jgi:ABC-2 type transport system permease protein